MTLDNATLLLLQREAVGKALAFQQQQQQHLQLLCRENELRAVVPTPLLKHLAVISPCQASAFPVHVLSPLHCGPPVYHGEPALPPDVVQAILLRGRVQQVLEERFRTQQMKLLKPLQQRATPELAPVPPATATTASPGGSRSTVPRACASVSPVADPLHHEEEEFTVASASALVQNPAKQESSDDESHVKENRPSPSNKRVKTNSAKKDAKWLASLEKLKQYKDAHGDCIVPRGYSADPRLASWVAEQRKQYKLLQDGKPSSITRERVALLEELDFSWNAQVSAWARHLEDLKRFRTQTGHCCVPLNHPEFPKLGLWVKEQRRHYTLMKQGKPSHMTEERATELDKVGFCWDTHEATWLERFRELEAFREIHGNCLVPTNYADNPRLGTWVHHQRRQYKKFKDDSSCHITEERIRALEGLGFVWSTRDKGEASASLGYHSESDDDLSAPGMRPGSLSFRPYKRPRLRSSCEEV